MAFQTEQTGETKKREQTGTADKGINEQLNTLNSRIRLFEETINEFRKRIIFIEQNLVAYHKKAMTDIKAQTIELTDTKKTILMIEDRIITLIKEMRLLARKEDVDVIKKYVELLNPMKYVTAERVDQLIGEILEEKEGRTYERPTNKIDETHPKEISSEDEEKAEIEIHKKRKQLNPEDVFSL